MIGTYVRHGRVREGIRACAGDLGISRRNDRRLQPCPTDGAGVGPQRRPLARHLRQQGRIDDRSQARFQQTRLHQHWLRHVVNTAYVALDHPDDGHAPPESDEITACTVFYGVLKHSGAELSAHQTIVAEQEHWSSITQLAAEYETIAAVAQRDRWVSLLEGCGLTDAQLASVLQSDSFGPLTAELRRAEANRYDVDQLLPALVTQRSLEDADDVGAVLISRLRRATRPERGKRPRQPRYIVGPTPMAEGPMSQEMSAALAARPTLMEARAMALADKAVETNEPWLERLGTPP